jgi:ketol-acid reductoisomerase
MASMTRAQQQRIEEYETAAAESDMLAQLTADRSKQIVYTHLAGHFRDLARGFRETLGVANGLNPL